jgi:tripartite-type tricarboxylate transporter receptor subunit TctC
MALSAGAVHAQSFPQKPLRFVVGYPPGGSGDFVTRTVGEAIAAELGQTAIIDNRPGAAGNLASEIVLKAPADGYTLLVGSNPYINKALYKKLPYDIEKDFQRSDDHCSQQQLTGQQHQRSDRSCQKEPWQTQFCFQWQWVSAAFGRCAVQQRQ